MPRLVQSLILLGVPGLVLGSAAGAIFPRWKAVVLLAALGGLALWFGIEHMPEGSEEEDDDPVILIAIALFMNLAGWILGLVAGALGSRLRGDWRRLA